MRAVVANAALQFWTSIATAGTLSVRWCGLVEEAKGERAGLEGQRQGRDPAGRRGKRGLVNLDVKNPNAAEALEHLPPNKLVEDILPKEQRIISIMGEVQAVLREGGGKMTGRKKHELIPIDQIALRIQLIRGQRVIVDADLAWLYGVTTKRVERAGKAEPGSLSRRFRVAVDGRGEVRGGRKLRPPCPAEVLSQLAQRIYRTRGPDGSRRSEYTPSD
jgi:hypothetical protein